jgi:DNA-binding CsgD family transcriptional regulator/PAS domain-containing protein
MDKTGQLSALIGDIYDAAFDPASWPDVLHQVAGFVGGSGGALFAQDTVSQMGNSYYDVGVDPHYRESYFNTYIKFNPMNAACAILDIGDVISNSSVVPHTEFLETRFYKEWVQPQGWIDNVVGAIERSPTSTALVTVFRHQRDGLADEGARQRLRLLVPHLRRAVVIGKVIDYQKAETATLADTLDGLAAGAFLVDAAARIVRVNAAGYAMLGAGELFRAINGRLVAIEPQAERTLADIVATAASGGAAIGIKGIAVPLTTNSGQDYVAHVLPLTSGARRKAGTSYAAVAAIFVHKAALDVHSPLELLARRFRLTPSELQVLLAVVEVGGAPKVAETLGIAENTVKTHLRRLFEKTGTTRQAELVKLVAAFSSQLLS